jgi:hypothetical protein
MVDQPSSDIAEGLNKEAQSFCLIVAFVGFSGETNQDAKASQFGARSGARAGMRVLRVPADVRLFKIQQDGPASSCFSDNRQPGKNAILNAGRC